MNNEFYIKLSATVKGLVDGMKKASDSVKDVGKNIEETGKEMNKSVQGFEGFKRGTKIFEEMDRVTGGLATDVAELGDSFKALFSGVKDLGSGFNKVSASSKVAGASMRGALIATGIGALLVAVGLLIAYWDDVKDAVLGVNRELEEQQRIIDIQLGLRDSYIDTLKEEIKYKALIGEDTGALETKLKENIAKQIESNKAREKTLRLQKAQLLGEYQNVNALEGFLEAFGRSPFSKEKQKEINDLTVEINKTAGATSRLGSELFKLSNFEIPEVDLGTIKNKQYRPELPKIDITEFKQGIVELKKGVETEIKPTGLDKLAENVKIAIEKTNKELAGLKIKERAQEVADALDNFNEQANNIIQNGISSTFGQMAEAIGEAMTSGGNIIKGAGNALLAGLGGILISLGKMAIQVGVGLIVTKKALESLGGAGAIVAGVALVALGSMFSKTSKSLGSSMGSGASSSSGGGSGSGGSRSYGSSGGGFGGGKVVFEIAGTKLIGVLSNTLKENSALSGKFNVTG